MVFRRRGSPDRRYDVFAADRWESPDRTLSTMISGYGMKALDIEWALNRAGVDASVFVPCMELSSSAAIPEESLA
jgi:hypothetical protein